MWPQALQMTRDECRGILRRLELESYSHVISVFRAQGGLSENKAKLLEELRSIFHISQERHRAEARRVANDEQLSTIAEAISGPNTWQEWSREGRRSFPMLPRVAPQTALALIANSVAAETSSENSKLPYPVDTAVPLATEQAAYAEQAAKYDGEKMRWNIVSSDPFKVPDIPIAPKKTLKRNIPDSQYSNSKRRSVNEASTIKMQQQTQYPTDVGPLTATSNIRKLYHNHSKIQQQQQQQKAAYQQQIQKQKSASKKSRAAQTKRQPATKGKRAQTSREQLQQEQQQQQQQELQYQQSQQQDQKSLISQTRETEQNQQLAYSQSTTTPIDMDLEPIEESKEATIAASKKDISKNLTKLHIPPPTAISTGATTLRVQPMEGAVSSSSPTILHGSKSDKQLISTPVQKYIVEDRQSPAAAAVQSSTTPPQIMTLPQLSAAASKLRTMNTTILPPGTKLTTTKKYPISVTSATDRDSANQSNQVYSIIEGTTITSSNLATTAHLPSTPTHTPPAVIQLNSSSSSTDQTPIQPTQGKVLTTKLLPIVLSSSSASKIETLNNGATLVTGGSSIGTAANSSLFKTLPSSMLVSTSGAGNTMTLSNTIASGAHTVFRKQPNIIKAGIIGMSSSVGSAAGKIPSAYSGSGTTVSTAGSGGAQIISNIKLASAVVTSGSGTSTSTQQFLKNVATSGIRTSVKICQSPNGKMFIQPANADALKTTKLQTSLQQKLLPSQFSATGGGSSATTPQRIAIQKVQIIPAPMSSPGSLPGSMQQQQQQQKPTSSLTLSNKANMIFMPTTCSARGTATISLPKGGTIGNIGTKSQQHLDVSKQNVFVIGAVAQQQGLKSSNRESSNQMITEDTPVDILNMPIIVDNSNTSAMKSVSSSSIPLMTANSGSNIGDTVTVISNEILETGSSNINPAASAVVLGVTDWEMELDQATAVAAASKAARTQKRTTAISISKSRKSFDQQQPYAIQQQQQHNTIVVDDNFDDVIVEETFIDEGTHHEDEQEEVLDSSNDANLDLIMVADKDERSYQQQDQPDQPDQPEQQQRLVQKLHPNMHQQLDDDMQIEVVDEDQHRENNKTLEADIMNAAEKSQLDYENRTEKLEEKIAQGTEEGTIGAELDENTAIEYIEEDHNDDGGEDSNDGGANKSQEMEHSDEDAGKALERILAGEKPTLTIENRQRITNPNNCGMESIISLDRTDTDVEMEKVTANSLHDEH